MNQFCEMKGILRQFSVARTPQQNGVAERRNMTLIEAARTMLADFKLPHNYFWQMQFNMLAMFKASDKRSKQDKETKIRVSFNQRNNPPQNPGIVYPPILNIKYFRHFLVILEYLYPMDDEPMWAVDRVVAPTPGSAITIPETANEFAIKGNHLTLVKGNQFDGRTKTDPHKHIHEFIRICDMFKYRDTKNEVVRLMMFPLSLTGEAKTWLDEINKGTIEMWDELRTAFISRFFPPALFDRLLGEIRAFLNMKMNL
ncbi:reverse transcriptase domain-containing protein [Tanacetum coccineum]